MPYIFVDDGYPEAIEFENNYVWIDPLHPVNAALSPRRRGFPKVERASRKTSARWKRFRAFFHSLELPHKP